MVRKKTSSGKSKRVTRTSTARKKRSSNQRVQRRKNQPQKRFLFSRKIWMFLGSASLSMMILGLGIIVWLASELPSMDQLESYNKPPGIRIYDAQKNLIGGYGHVVGNYVAYDEIPKQMINALLATEDRRFFEHSGVDPFGIARAAVRNVMAGGVVQGGSTITQQLAKNTFLTPERTLKRKIQEVMLSMWIENHFSKEKIIEIYLNRVYLGGGNYGVDAASHHYFDKSAKDLSLQESAMLVGLLKAPSRYAPTRDRELALGRTKQVILNMKNAEMLNDEAASKAIGSFDEMIQFKVESGNGSRYFADWVVDLIPQYIGQVAGDIEVFTTLDARLQLSAEEKITKHMEATGGKRNATQAALLSMTPDGAIKAMVGGLKYNDSQFNRTTQAKRQPGSAFKMYVYLAALDSGLSPNSWVVDKPVRYGSWRPKNYNGRYLGDMRLREAFFRSVNTVAVQLMAQTGVDTVLDLAKRMGVESKLTANYATALGASEMTMLELVGSYAMLANEGRNMKPYAIRKIVSQQSQDLLYERTGKEVKEEQVVRKNIVHMMNDLTTDTIAYGTGKAANIGRSAGGKTGTSQNFRDAWFVGYTPQFVTGVWIGNDDNTPTQKISGGGLPARVWRDYMRVAHAGKPVLPIPQQFEYVGGVMGNVPYGPEMHQNLPWRPEESTSSGSASNLPWKNRRRERRDRMRYNPGENPRYQLHRGAPVSRDTDVYSPPPKFQLPTSQGRSVEQPVSPPEPVRPANDEQSSVETREYEYPSRKKKRIF